MFNTTDWGRRVREEIEAMKTKDERLKTAKGNTEDPAYREALDEWKKRIKDKVDFGRK